MIDLFLFQISHPSNTQILSSLVIVTIIGFAFYKIKANLIKQSSGYRASLYLLNLLAGLSLLALILKPVINNTISDSVAVITSEINQSNLIENVDAKTIYKIDSVLASSQNKNSDKDIGEATVVQNLSSIIYDLPDITTLKVFGDGFKEEDWVDALGQYNEQVAIEFKASTPRIGFTHIDWTSKINLGDYLHVQGRIHTSDPRVNVIALLDPAGDQVSEFKLLPHEPFSISGKPKISGRHTYQVVLKDSKNNELVREDIHVLVENQAQSKIIVFQSSPSFEIKQLQNWAAENGAQMMIQTKISKDRYITRLTNLEGMNQRNFSLELLQQFQLMVVDGRALMEFNSTQMSILESALNNGLGLIVIADQSLTEANTQSQLPEWLNPLALKANSESRELVPYWSDNLDGFTAPVESFIPIMAAEFSAAENSSLNYQTKTLVQASNGWPIVKSTRVGLGKVAVSLIRNSHYWVTSGDKTSYSHYWQNLISQIASPMRNKFKLASESEPRFVFEKNTICIQSSSPVESITLRSVENFDKEQEIYLADSSTIPNQYCGVFWPEYAGWYQVTYYDELNSESSQNWLSVYSLDSWSAFQQTTKTRDTLRFQQRQSQSVVDGKKTVYQPINPWFFWWIFIISAGLIWVENKYLRSEN